MTLKTVIWYSYLAGEASSDKKLDSTFGFWINMTDDDILEIEGYELEDPDVEFDNGWNLIGYPYLEESLINETLKYIDYSAVFAYDGTWLSYIPDRTKNTLTKLNPGSGYWVKII